ncbi:MAG TPA: EthD family reductase, partial [Bryobacteraceae bacterium]
AFDKYYYETHIPLAKTIPGVRQYIVSKAPPRVMAGNPIHLVGELTFDSMADLEAALTSPEGQATAGDLANFAQAGVSLYIVDSASL